MAQLKLILKRLKNPSVIISIASQIISILILCNVDVNAKLASGIIASATSILVALGILSNPDTKKKSFSDDLYYCKDCGKLSQHTMIAGKMVCNDCGNEYSSEEKLIKKSS